MTTTPAAPPPATAQDLVMAMHQSPAFRALPLDEQERMRAQAAKVFGYLEGAEHGPRMALSLNQGPGGAPAPVPAPGAPQPNQSSVDRMPGVSRNALEGLAFPEFVASLVQGTFQAIVDSSIQQMEAYSQLLASVSKTVDQFMDEHITDDMARDHLADNYGQVFQREVTPQGPKLGVAPPPPAAAGGTAPLPSFLQDLGFSDASDIDEPAMNEAVIPEVRRTLAETRHQSLATMVMMGMNRIVVDEGEINAKLIFNVDASETSTVNFDDNKPTNWTLAGTAGRNAFGASGLVVTTTNLNTQSDISVRAELTGEVRIKFKSDYFPMERFADSQAIQLINNHAKPFPSQNAQEAPVEGEATEIDPVTAPPPPPLPGTSSQSLSVPADTGWGDPERAKS
ncbi:hypothetical protein [Yoonia sp.]|uniref:hypothetical protein n=1 Tax=Yoonia sp. TaxID=2212373 RepID=UPI00358EF3ED